MIGHTFADCGVFSFWLPLQIGEESSSDRTIIVTYTAPASSVSLYMERSGITSWTLRQYLMWYQAFDKHCKKKKQRRLIHLKPYKYIEVAQGTISKYRRWQKTAIDFEHLIKSKQIVNVPNRFQRLHEARSFNEANINISSFRRTK